MEQSVVGISSMSGRRLLISWILCSIIISTCYKGIVTSSLMSTKNGDSMSLEDAVKLKYHFCIELQVSMYL